MCSHFLLLIMASKTIETAADLVEPLTEFLDDQVGVKVEDDRVVVLDGPSLAQLNFQARAWFVETIGRDVTFDGLLVVNQAIKVKDLAARLMGEPVVEEVVTVLADDQDFMN